MLPAFLHGNRQAVEIRRYGPEIEYSRAWRIPKAMYDRLPFGIFCLAAIQLAAR